MIFQSYFSDPRISGTCRYVNKVYYTSVHTSCIYLSKTHDRGVENPPQKYDKLANLKIEKPARIFTCEQLPCDPWDG